MAKYRMQADTQNCSGCMRCMLACSELFTRSFNPLAARLMVTVSGPDCAIVFTDDCSRCGTCADHCFYGALHKIPMEADA